VQCAIVQLKQNVGMGLMAASISHTQYPIPSLSKVMVIERMLFQLFSLPITIRFYRVRFLSSHPIPCKINGSLKRNFTHKMAPLAKHLYHMLDKQQLR